ncbi:hypothetical protein [Parenemella sanctibonifatiensis]|uniref:Adhesin domain-containing protein n=1 Tax=Parenemella sanctibonifatiensis TaxID=2016505 RepID=A0A255EL83_9ACTN|nr:hypothetical protein [Parenemella sanctibonifatiensis]OYN92298.1 hypothetical protein CGZ91_01975 [Parenemella sanctibonifatiensis]
MTDAPDLTPILNDLAAGRIDAAEAQRRIQQLRQADDPVDAAGARRVKPGGGRTEAETVDQVEDVAEHVEPEDTAAADTDAAQAGEKSTEKTGDKPTDWRSNGDWRAYSRESFRSEPAQEEKTAETKAEPEPEAKSATEAEEDFSKHDDAEVERVSVRVVGRRLRVVGDAKVAAVEVEGPHVLRRNGAVIEVTSDGDEKPERGLLGLPKLPGSFDDIKSMGLGKELIVRVNPGLLADVELIAGSLSTQSMPALGTVRVTASGAHLQDVNELDNLLVQAGQVTVEGRIRTGRNRIRCESGSLIVRLAEGSNVTVHADTQLGRIAWSGQHSGSGDEVVMGNGAARLDVSVVMGYAQIKVGNQD